MRSKTDIDMLQKAVNSKFEPIYMTRKSEVIDYYKDTYGKDKWTRALAEKLHGSIKNRKGEDVSVRNIQRRFQAERPGQGENSKVFKDVGKSLPPIGKKLPGNSITITVTGNQDRGKKHGGMIEGKKITVTFSGPDAYSFADNPTYGDIWSEYGVDPDDFEEGSGELEVTGVS